MKLSGVNFKSGIFYIKKFLALGLQQPRVSGAITEHVGSGDSLLCIFISSAFRRHYFIY